MMTIEEVEAFFAQRLHERDSASFQREQLAEARKIIASLPEPEYERQSA